MWRPSVWKLWKLGSENYFVALDTGSGQDEDKSKLIAGYSPRKAWRLTRNHIYQAVGEAQMIQVAETLGLTRLPCQANRGSYAAGSEDLGTYTEQDNL